MQTLNLQAPKTLDVDVSAKAKGTQPAKKTPSKSQPAATKNQAKKASFRQMVDESAKQEPQINPKSTQSPAAAQETVSQQSSTGSAATKDAHDADCQKLVRTGESERTDEAAQGKMAFAQGSPLEVSWLQSALGSQTVQEQSESALAEPLGESEIAFLKTDPLFDEGFMPSGEAALSLAQTPSVQDTDQASLLPSGTPQELTGEFSAGASGEAAALEGDTGELLVQEGEATAALFVPAEATGKQKDNASLTRASAQAESLQPLGEIATALDEADGTPAAAGEGVATVDVQAVQNELLGDVFTVTDLRTPSQKSERTGEAVDASKTQSGEGRQELSMELSLPQTTHTATPTPVKEASGVPSFQRLLSEQLRSGAPDFAKAGSIVLRGENEGTIKLMLRPESLGNVKINLQLSDNVITGKIAVASKEAFEAFKQNIGALRQAFSDSGFEGAEFTLSYFDSSSGFAQESGGQNDGRFLSNKAYADYVSGEGGLGDAGEVQAFTFDTDKTVNVVA